MLRNYFLIAWRNFIKNRTFYLINIFGLSVGITCCLLIGSYVYSELTYDTYPEHANEIHRVELHVSGNGNWVDYSSVDFGVGPGLTDAFPEILSFTRLSSGYMPYLRYHDVVLKEQNLAIADSNFLDFFSIPLLAGNRNTALSEPNQLVISKAFAKRYFGEDDPMGKIITVGNTGVTYTITGIFHKIPNQSHFHFDAFLSGATMASYNRNTWSNIGMFTYIQLSKGADPKVLERKFPNLVKKHVVPEIQADMGVSLAEAEKAVGTFVFLLRPLRDIHLYSHTIDELSVNGDIKYVYIFGALAVFILLLACINFINLSTATSTRRAREVGIRKVMGSVKSQLIGQFLTESIILTGFATLLAYGFIAASLPLFNQLTGKLINFDFFIQPSVLLLIVGSVLLLGLIAGIYPSFFLSSFNTISVLKGNTDTQSGRKDFVRSGLVVFQFAVSTALIVATLIVYQQLSFMQNKKLGYDKEQVLVIHETRALRGNEVVFKDELRQDSRVRNATISNQMPGEKNMDGTQAYAKDRLGEDNAEIHINIFHIDYDYLNTLGIDLAYGRNLSPDFPSDSSAVILNETAAYEFGWTPETAVDKTFVRSGQYEFHVVGVVKDFNYASARQKVAPLVMMLHYNSGAILVKLQATDITSFLADTRARWDTYSTEIDIPFSYTFLDEKFNALYHAEKRTGQIFTAFATIAIVIAGMGLFGLSTFTAEQRIREIGIRKVLGASSQQVLFMLSKQFMLLVILAIVISTPVVTWIMNHWLEDFAYRISIPWWIFVFAAGISFLIAFFSMSVQAFRAAITNPVTSLKQE